MIFEILLISTGAIILRDVYYFLLYLISLRIKFPEKEYFQKKNIKEIIL